MKKLLAILLAIMLTISLVGCGGTTTDETAAPTTGTSETPEPSDTATEHDPFDLNIYTWTAGSSTNTYGIALADIINQNSTWLHATALVSESQNANANILINNEQTSAIGYCVLPVVYNGYPPFQEPNEDLRMIAAMAQNSNCYMTLDPDIKTLADLDGKKVMLGNPGGYLRCDLPQTMFENLGIEPEFSYGGIPDSVEALINGQVDAILGGGIAVTSDLSEWVMSSAYTELLSRFDVYFVSIDAAGMEYAMEEWNFASEPGPTVIAPGAYYKTQQEELTVMSTTSGWCCNKDLPDDVILEILTIMADHADEFGDYLESGNWITLENMAKVDSPDWIHDAAKQFYIDNEVWNPDN